MYTHTPTPRHTQDNMHMKGVALLLLVEGIFVFIHSFIHSFSGCLLADPGSCSSAGDDRNCFSDCCICRCLCFFVLVHTMLFILGGVKQKCKYQNLPFLPKGLIFPQQCYLDNTVNIKQWKWLQMVGKMATNLNSSNNFTLNCSMFNDFFLFV